MVTVVKMKATSTTLSASNPPPTKQRKRKKVSTVGGASGGGGETREVVLRLFVSECPSGPLGCICCCNERWWCSDPPHHCVVSCYQPHSDSGDTFLMFYLRVGVETRVAKYIKTIPTRNSWEQGISTITERRQVMERCQIIFPFCLIEIKCWSVCGTED